MFLILKSLCFYWFFNFKNLYFYWDMYNIFDHVLQFKYDYYSLYHNTYVNKHKSATYIQYVNVFLLYTFILIYMI